MADESYVGCHKTSRIASAELSSSLGKCRVSATNALILPARAAPIPVLPSLTEHPTLSPSATPIPALRLYISLSGLIVPGKSGQATEVETLPSLSHSPSR